MEWDDYLRQQAATYRQLAEKAEDPVVKKNSSTWQTSAKRSPTTSRIVLQAGKWHEPIFATRLEGLDFKLHPKKPMAFCSTPTETLYGGADRGSPWPSSHSPLCYPGLAGGTLRVGKRLDSEHFRFTPRTGP